MVLPLILIIGQFVLVLKLRTQNNTCEYIAFLKPLLLHYNGNNKIMFTKCSILLTKFPTVFFDEVNVPGK